MKAIHSLKTVVDGNKVTITGELVDVTMPSFIGQRTTILHPVATNPSHPRHIQVNSHGTVFLRNGADGVLFPKDELAAVALEIDSKLTDAPIFVKSPSPDNLTGDVRSELPLTATIQESDNGKDWKDVTSDSKSFKGEKGKHYRCVAKNKLGEVTSNPVKLK